MNVRTTSSDACERVASCPVHLSAGALVVPRIPDGLSDSLDVREGDVESERQEVQEHLRAASDAILLLVRQVGQLEQHKRGVTPGDARFDELAQSVRRAAQILADFAKEEEAWARGAAAAGGPFDVISATRNPASLSTILERWRAVERQLEDAPPGSAEAAELFDAFNGLRDEYMREFRERSERSPG